MQNAADDTVIYYTRTVFLMQGMFEEFLVGQFWHFRFAVLGYAHFNENNSNFRQLLHEIYPNTNITSRSTNFN